MSCCVVCVRWMAARSYCNSPRSMSTPALTHDAVSHVMWFMDPVDIVRCGRVNRAWRTASQSRMLWARLCASESIVPIVGDSYQTAYLYAACGAFRAHRFALVEAEMARLKNGPWHLQMSTLTRDVPLMLQSAANYFRGVELSQGMLNAKRRAFGDDPNEMALLRRIQLVSDSGAQWVRCELRRGPRAQLTCAAAGGPCDDIARRHGHYDSRWRNDCGRKHRAPVERVSRAVRHVRSQPRALFAPRRQAHDARYELRVVRDSCAAR